MYSPYQIPQPSITCIRALLFSPLGLVSTFITYTAYPIFPAVCSFATGLITFKTFPAQVSMSIDWNIHMSSQQRLEQLLDEGWNGSFAYGLYHNLNIFNIHSRKLTPPMNLQNSKGISTTGKVDLYIQQTHIKS